MTSSTDAQSHPLVESAGNLLHTQSVIEMGEQFQHFLMPFSPHADESNSSMASGFWVGVNQPVLWFLGGKGLGIQQGTSVWVDSPKSGFCPGADWWCPGPVVVKLIDYIDVFILGWKQEDTLSTVFDDLVMASPLHPIMNMCRLVIWALIWCRRQPISSSSSSLVT